MNSILRIYVLLILNVTAQHTEVLTVTLDLTLDISKQSTLHNQVHYSLRIKSSCKYISCEIYYSSNYCQLNNKSNDLYLHELLILRE